MKPLIESKKAWELLLYYWRTRDDVNPDMRCPVIISYHDDRVAEQCVLDESHAATNIYGVSIPHVDQDGNIARLMASDERIESDQ